MSEEIATLGGGCFWCLEAVYKDLRGVRSVMSGYAGGHVTNPSYKAVCAGTTGHAEVVQVKFDPAEVSYADLLRVFFTIHDAPANVERTRLWAHGFVPKAADGTELIPTLTRLVGSSGKPPSTPKPRQAPTH